MSRVGSKPISLPAGTKVTVKDGQLEVQGPKGVLTSPIPSGIEFKLDDATLTATRDSNQYAALHGLARSLANNAITGVTSGFTKRLEIVGIGYRAQISGRVVVFALGYSHSIELLMPEGIEIEIGKTVSNTTLITVSGIDKQVVGQTAAKIRALRPPDPYKNKGVRYAGEILRKKEGKTGATA